MKNFKHIAILCFVLLGCASTPENSRYYADAEEQTYIKDQDISWLIKDSLKTSSLLVVDASFLKPGSITGILSPNFLFGDIIDNRKKLSAHSSAANSYLKEHKEIKNCKVERVQDPNDYDDSSDYEGYLFFYSC